MKKITLSLAAIVFAINFSYAQWTAGTGTIYPTTITDKVGIGTSSPGYLLDVNGVVRVGSSSSRGILAILGSTTDVPALSLTDLRTGGNAFALYGGGSATGNFDIYDQTAGAYRFTINSSGNIGIGTTSPAEILDVNGKVKSNSAMYITKNGADPIGAGPFFQLGSATGTTYLQGMQLSAAGHLDFWSYNGSTFAENMRIQNNGNVGIGTTTPDQLLSVAGNIHAEEVLVNLTGFEDRVFKKAYHLPTLTQVKTYIEKNHHLPDVPSEAEVIKNGLKLGDMDRLLTKKVEELTLYLIEKDKQLKTQDERIKALEASFNKTKTIKPKLSHSTKNRNHV